MDTYRIILADDHRLLRQGVRRILSEKKRIEVIGEASCGLELLALLKKMTPDLIILDISMPNLRGLEALEEIKALHPETSVLILTMHKDRQYLHQALAAGAQGYLLKEDTEAELFAAIDSIRQKKIYISPFFRNGLAEDLAATWQGRLKGPFEELLTTRERQILKMIAEGKSSREIAGLLFISVRTVERHRFNMMSKLKLKKNTDLVKYAIQKGYV